MIPNFACLQPQTPLYIGTYDTLICGYNSWQLPNFHNLHVGCASIVVPLTTIPTIVLFFLTIHSDGQRAFIRGKPIQGRIYYPTQINKSQPLVRTSTAMLTIAQTVSLHTAVSTVEPTTQAKNCQTWLAFPHPLNCNHVLQYYSYSNVN